MLLALALLAYPLAVYLLIDTLSPIALAGVLALVTTVRLVLAKHMSKRATALGLAAVAVRRNAHRIRQKLPEGFQRSEFLLEHGMLDLVVPRRELKATVARCLTYFH